MLEIEWHNHNMVGKLCAMSAYSNIYLRFDYMINIVIGHIGIYLLRWLIFDRCILVCNLKFSQLALSIIARIEVNICFKVLQDMLCN